MQAVWGETLAGIKGADRYDLGAAIDASEAGFFVTDWESVPIAASQLEEIFVGIVVKKASESVNLNRLILGVAEVRLRDAGAGEVVSNLNFFGDAPGNLVLEGSEYFADWDIAPGNFGYSDAAAAALIESWLHDAQGWSQAGVTFRRVEGAPVTFQIVEESTGGTGPDYARTHFGPGYVGASVELEYSRIQAGFGRNITNHEAGHAFFLIGHSGTGIMAGQSPDGNPTASDIQSVIDWLAS